MEEYSLKNYIYINPKITNDYLSSVNQNYNRVSGTEKVEKKQSLGIEKGIKANIGNTTSEENQLEYLSVDSANFNQLYVLLETKSLMKYYETIDDQEWAKLSRRDVIDSFVQINHPNINEFAMGANEITPLLQLLSGMSNEFKIDKKASAALSLFNMIDRKDRLDLIMPMVDSPQFKFYGKINPEYLKIDRSQLKGEYNVVGKIIKIVQKSQPVKISFLKEYLDIFSSNKLIKDKMKSVKLPKDFEEVIKFPAAELDILAIYR